MSEIRLTPRQKDVLDFIRLYIETNGGMAPTRQEIAEGLFLSVPRIAQHLFELRCKGFVKVQPGKHRGITVVGE